MFVNMCECVCVDVGGTGGYEHVISMCVCLAELFHMFVCLRVCTGWCDCFSCVCMYEC